MMPMHVDLSDAAGLPISLDLETGKLDATGDVDLGEQGERRLSQLREVLEDPEAATDDRVCYRTYRGVGTKADLTLLEQHGLRYDITVTLPGLIGREFVKTAGHHHLSAPGGRPYPEVYEVVYGRATFVLQGSGHVPGMDPVVAGAWVQTCGPGDRIVIPEWAHVTVNIGLEPLVVSDLIAEACTNDYGRFQSAHGAGYYVVSEDDRIVVKYNSHYGYHAVPILDKGSRWPSIFPSNAPLIENFRQEPETFRWLVDSKIFSGESEDGTMDSVFECWRPKESNQGPGWAS
jgi:glucose-6-phosphate isomerase